MGISLHVCTKHLLSTHEFFCVPLPFFWLIYWPGLWLWITISCSNRVLLSANESSFDLSNLLLYSSFCSVFSVMRNRPLSLMADDMSLQCLQICRIWFHNAFIAYTDWTVAFRLVQPKNRYIYNKLHFFLHNMESKLYYFHLMEVSDRKCMFLFDMIVLYYYSVWMMFSLLILLTINWRFSIEHISNR